MHEGPQQQAVDSDPLGAALMPAPRMPLPPAAIMCFNGAAPVIGLEAAMPGSFLARASVCNRFFAAKLLMAVVMQVRQLRVRAPWLCAL